MTSLLGDGLDPRTPVFIGVGQVAEHVDDSYYTGQSPAELASSAACNALFDATGPAQELGPAQRLAAAIDVVAAVRLFEDSGLAHPSELGRSDNLPRSIARRIAAAPQRAIYEVGGGQSPTHLANEFAAEVAAGKADVVLLAGAEALSSARHWRAAPHEAAGRPNWNETSPGQLQDRGQGLDDMTAPALAALGLDFAPAAYALFENARRARLGQTRAQYARGMGELFAPFTHVAAANPLAAVAERRSPEQLSTPSARNRLIVDPYPRFLVARDQVNQGAAVLLTSVGRALELGIPQERLIFCHGHADVTERDVLERADLSSSPAAVMAVSAALADAGIEAGELDFVDLYSCFPIAVSNIVDVFFPAADRSFTVTGGLPFFGGPGNNYSMHATVEMVRRLRAAPGSYGMVTANGGVLSKYSVGIYSSAAAPWQPGRSADLQREIDAWAAPDLSHAPHGPARIESYTVVYERGGARRGIVVGRLVATDERFLAATRDDPATWALLESEQPIGARVEVATQDGRSQVRAVD
ncbi:acetyl-CoA acetyltransferase [Gephyromycinifex aptenodytis]|uniref:acetyl-CoA acetyltransferase n=1 Tax=Gephyromycinifex aptenodytis TaxID=2716227 RepID=UPI001444FDD4|nr:acetyl-CoA acetyltransferase [Gephyromycinifex aptenodytis]